MEAGRKKNLATRMKGTINEKHKLTDIYLPRKCDYTDRVITSKDHSSVQLCICNIKSDGTIDLSTSNLITLCGYVRSTGQSDAALDKVLAEKKLV
jgi:small subunit ribosomal protein S21e